MADSESDISEESEYSGLEEEEDTSDEDSPFSGSENEEDSEEGSETEDTSQTPNGEASHVQPKAAVPDEYSYDSSDEEDLRNTVGNIPMEWYKEFEHIGYDLKGQKIGKPEAGDELEAFLKKMEDVNFWKTVKDSQTGQDVVLSDTLIDTIKKMKKGKYVDNDNPYAPWVDFFSHEVMEHPLTNHPPQKRSFIPSKWEKMKVGHLVHAMKMGWIKPDKTEKEDEDKQEKYYMLWNADTQEERNKRHRDHIPAPKLALPGHEESYNPPREYLFTDAEEENWKNQEPYERKVNFIPKKYSSLRLVPAFATFINERFERCLDLYLCPRQVKMKMNVDPSDLIPNLPKPRDLQPFPTHQSLLYKGHTDMVRSIAVDPTGQWMISGSDDCTVKLWEVATGRCMRTITLGSIVRHVSWSPTVSPNLVAVATDNDMLVFCPNLGDKLIVSKTVEVLKSLEKVISQQPTDTESGALAKWSYEMLDDHRGQIKVTHPKTVSQISWHAGGDYISVCMPKGENVSVLIHQLSLCRTQNPFKKSKGMVQSVLFHPTKPLLFVATQRYVRIYNLLKQELIKKLLTNSKWVSSMAIHPSGNHIIIGSYDCKLSWFDLDLSAKPYKTLRHHSKAIRQVCYHKKYPLFASASDDGSVIVCHGMVYNDLLQNPLIVPVKILRGHQVKDHLSALDCVFHPTQPWILSCGADSTIRLYS